jgi:hypothetical protein
MFFQMLGIEMCERIFFLMIEIEMREVALNLFRGSFGMLWLLGDLLLMFKIEVCEVALSRSILSFRML